MRIEEYSLADLRGRLEDRDFWSQSVLPISKHRAIAQVHNPRADEDDVLLIVAYGDKGPSETVAYIGILPDRVFLEGREQKVGWLSCWWVNPKAATGGIGAMLLFRAINSYSGHVASYSPAPVAEEIITSTRQFVPLYDLHGVTGILRFNTSYLLERRRPSARPLKPFLKLLDRFGNLVGDARISQRIRTRHGASEYSLDYVSAIDSETEAFITRHRSPAELFRRGKAELDWIYTYPWVIAAPLPDRLSARYDFTATARTFSFYMVKIRRPDGELAAFLLLKLKNETLTVPYAYFTPDSASLVLDSVLGHALSLRADMVTILNSELVQGASADRPRFLYRWPTARHCYISKRLKPGPSGVLQPGDGDGAFT